MMKGCYARCGECVWWEQWEGYCDCLNSKLMWEEVGYDEPACGCFKPAVGDDVPGEEGRKGKSVGWRNGAKTDVAMD